MPNDTASADWYADPFSRHERRYWDGSKWTHHVVSRGVTMVDPPGATPSPAGWYPDPFGRHETRYWDGVLWTEHVASRGTPGVDPPVGPPVAHAVGGPRKKKVERQVNRAGAYSGLPGGGTLVTEQVLVVNQKAKLIGNLVEYAVFDQQGRRIGGVRELRRGFMANAASMRPVENRTRKLQVVDSNGRLILALTRPANFIKSTFIVRNATGAEVGQIIQKTMGLIFGARFLLESRGQPIGSIQASGSNAWDFGIMDADGSEIGRVTKTWAGWTKERFTKADNYVVEMHEPLADPLRSLVIAAALALDIALKEGRQTHGSSLWGTRRYQ